MNNRKSEAFSSEGNETGLTQVIVGVNSQSANKGDVVYFSPEIPAWQEYYQVVNTQPNSNNDLLFISKIWTIGNRRIDSVIGKGTIWVKSQSDLPATLRNHINAVLR